VNDPDVKLLILILLGAGLAGALWFFKDDIFEPDEAPVVVLPDPIAEEPSARTGPAYPITQTDTSPSQGGELVPLPPLDDSDSYFLLALIDSFGPDVGNVLVSEALIDKFVATVDNLSRSHVAEKLRPVGRLQGVFDVDVVGGESQISLSSENYARYSGLVILVASADLEIVAATYRRFYPLFQESYVRLGYPNGYFNDRVVEIIDHLLQTPVPTEPVHLVQPHVLYEFADAELEALSSGQKLLLRMGRDNSTRIKQALSSLRALITQPGG
jgi:hypothetical protein